MYATSITERKRILVVKKKKGQQKKILPVINSPLSMPQTAVHDLLVISGLCD
jgi:hypothetical protein